MTKRPTQSLGDLMAEEEAKLLAKARREIAAEKAAWDALSPEEQAAIIAEREAKYAAFDAEPDDGDDTDEDAEDDQA